MDDYKDHLLGSVEPDRLMTRSYGHVIPTSNLLATPVAKSASGVEFDFTFGKRDSQPMVSHVAMSSVHNPLICERFVSSVLPFCSSQDEYQMAW